MARDLDLGVKVIGSKTVRERDGLAMSSRNVYLSPDERRVAPDLFRAMKQSAARLRAGDDVEARWPAAPRLIKRAGFALDYFEVRHAETLAPVASIKDGPLRILVAAKARQHPADRQHGGLASIALQQPEIAQFAPHRLRHRRDAAGGGLAEVGRRRIVGRR